MRHFTQLLAVFLVSSVTALPIMADWPQFRGVNASGLALDSNPPTTFAGETKTNIAWRVEAPGRGVGGPIIVGDQVITTSSSGMDQRRIYITSLSAKTGDVMWQQSLIARGRPFCHPTSANAAPTPASDGKLVFAFYSSNDLACVDLQGNLVWYRALAVDFPKAGNDVGMSASPIVADGVVVVQIENQGDSFVAGLEAETGELLWRKDRPKRANWSSPLAVKMADGRSIAVVQSSESLDGLDMRTGAVRWSLPMSCSSVPSSSTESGRLFVPSSGLTQIELASSDQPPKVGWNNSKLSANSASPVIYNGGVYVVNRSVLVRGDAVSGELSWQLRLPDAGTIWSSPVIAGNRLYLFTDNGRCFVVELGDKEGKIIETNELGEPVFGSPAVAGDAIFVRSDSAIWKIEKS